jgi:hypothetical protein
MAESVGATLFELVQSEGEAFYGDAARVESRLGDCAGDHPDEVAVLVTAVRAGVVDELLDVKPGLFDVAVSHLTSRMVRLYDTDPAAGRWAVESWAAALGAQAEPEREPAPPPPPEPEAEPPVEPGPPPASSRRFSVSWPWVAAVGAGAVGLIALIVLVRMTLGLVHTEGGNASPPPPSSTTSTSRTATTAAGALTVPPDISLGTGDVQVTLLWADGNDLDLHVIDPSGNEIYFSHPKSPAGGTLDHDDTAGCSSTGTHVENVFWPAGGAPPGRYQVFVKNYSSCGAPSRYSLKARAKGGIAISSSATVGAHEGDQTAVSQFSFS